MTTGPHPLDPHPMPGQPRVGFLKAFVKQPNIEVGDYTYYDDPRGPEGFVERCVQHHYDFIGDRLVIGRFCAIATGTTFIMNGANHAMTGFSTYPFNIFGRGWEQGFDLATIRAGFRGDTVVGNDVWIGQEATIMPGVRIGDGAIVAAQSVVTANVAPYAIVGGNPAREIRRRFPEHVIAELLAIRWWDWDAEKLTRNLDAIRGADLDALKRAT
ncbi:antibiotic acetyltransferase [Corallococcus sp. CA053C]|uniref:CatB-related O-acetyltransferase n=1 Tax=Corallococcus sp. CA053C TaxID=2316732 RepID=UPI000EA3C80E|nr:CatB-related O-acetyltransferase [Corallococcus sp. CA053C]RKH15432.1 antibiotic acetyltransferase [Corallococcus sp. CA053C]